MEHSRCPRCGGDHWGEGWPISGIACSIKNKSGPGGNDSSGGSAPDTYEPVRIKSKKIYHHLDLVENPITIKGAPYSLRILKWLSGFLTVMAVLASVFILLKLNTFWENGGETFGEFAKEHPLYLDILTTSGVIAGVFIFFLGVVKIFSGRKLRAFLFCKNCHNVICDANHVVASYGGGVCWLCGKINFIVIPLKKYDRMVKDGSVIHCRNCGFIGDFVLKGEDHCTCPICRNADQLILTDADKINLDDEVKKLEHYFAQVFKEKKDYQIVGLVNLGLVSIEEKYIKAPFGINKGPREWELGTYYSPGSKILWKDMTSSVDLRHVEANYFLTSQLECCRLSKDENGDLSLRVINIPKN